MLELSSITVKSQRRLWLDDVSVKATPGRILGVVGPKGAGKTELARAIMGIIEPESGTVKLEDNELVGGDRQNFGYLPAERGGFPSMKVMEQIVYMARLHGMTLGAAERNAVTLLARLELSDRAYVPLSQLSGTEQARVHIAAVLAADPDVVVIDEIGEGLDMASAKLVFGLLKDHADAGVPIIVTSDDWELIEQYADDILVLGHGSVIAHGTAKELRKEHSAKAKAKTDAKADAQPASLREIFKEDV
ncbi:ABC transporter ATP-binding protein [Brevibacterium sp. HMSC08F02]|uniref:ABC transporter ATP-binding protein n=1 Tax=Brevibacterium sp. HMSC08F02 TaxID=1581140 RepID=UPI0008A16B39|nr:ATP-binding cassette domain-containing protein [Brevibacterium sp. HMSC08F02]OFT26863.1 ABC transporter ATP-binding protein [Brevibacterium sp. HMSC08F02]